MNAINKIKRASPGRLAKQKICACSTIFLHQPPNTTSSIHTYTGTLDGKILTCPKKQDQFWTVKWSLNLTSCSETIPPNQLCKIIANNAQSKKLLLDAVLSSSTTSNLSASNTTIATVSHTTNDANVTTSSTDTTNTGATNINPIRNSGPGGRASTNTDDTTASTTIYSPGILNISKYTN